MASPPLTNAQRQAAFKAKRRSQGRSQLTIWVNAHERAHITRWLTTGGALVVEPPQPGDPQATASQLEHRLLALANQRGSEGDECVHALASFFEDLSLNAAFARSTREAAAVAAGMAYAMFQDAAENEDELPGI